MEHHLRFLAEIHELALFVFFVSLATFMLRLDQRALLIPFWTSLLRLYLIKPRFVCRCHKTGGLTFRLRNVVGIAASRLLLAPLPVLAELCVSRALVPLPSQHTYIIQTLCLQCYSLGVPTSQSSSTCLGTQNNAASVKLATREVSKDAELILPRPSCLQSIQLETTPTITITTTPQKNNNVPT